MKLQLQRLRKQYGTKSAVDNVSVNLTPGVYGLLGANGAGKTTLMRMICGVLKPTSGSIRLDGKTIQELGEQYYTHLGYMPQDFGFYPDFTAREFMLYMAAVKGLDKKSAKARTEELLELVNLRDVADKKIKSYSGGMKQRLGIAQAELNDPDILILDEVLSVGDGAFRKKSEAKMREIITGGATTILVSHSIQQVRSMCSKILWLHKGRQIEFGDDVQAICDRYQEFLEGKYKL